MTNNTDAMENKISVIINILVIALLNIKNANNQLPIFNVSPNICHKNSSLIGRNDELNKIWMIISRHKYMIIEQIKAIGKIYLYP